jgi:uncharacterized protein (DUF2236 family)
MSTVTPTSPPSADAAPDRPTDAPRTGFRSGFTPLESLDLRSGDPGYFGPDSISWRVHHDPASVVSGVRALALQSLHPEVMLGFHGVTSTREDPWGRLARTGRYVNAITYGTVAEADAVAARTRRVHAALGLDRPEWLLWVHCGAVDSWIVGHRRAGAPMSDSEADRYVEEQVIAARLIGCDVEDVPRTTAALRDYLSSVRPLLEVTPETREAVRSLLWPPMSPRPELLVPARLGWTTLALTGFGLLPRWARRMFALPGLPTTDLTATIAARTVRTALVALPESRRTNPHLSAARIRLGLAAERAAG